MSDGIFSRLVEEDLRRQTEAKSEEYVMVNVRPGEKVGAMLDLMSCLTGKTPSVLIAEKLSEELSDYAASSVANSTAIFEAAAKAVEQRSSLNGGALGLLMARGILEAKILFPKLKLPLKSS